MFAIPAFLSALFLPIIPILKAAIEVGTLIATTVLNFVVWYLKEFWKGLGVVFHNLSVLTVLLAAIIGGGYYFKTWDNDKVLRECIKTCPAPKEPTKYYHPIKREVYKKLHKPLVTKAAPKSTPSTFNPFGGN